MNTEEILYCDYCGGTNKPSAVICEHCNRKMRMKHSAFLVFLKANTKNALLGDIQDRAFKRIRNFLLSHIYGVVVSILVVTTVTTYAIPKDSHIEKVATEAPAVNAIEEEPEPAVTELSEEDRLSIYEMLNEYSLLCDTELIGDMGQTPTMTFSDIFADMESIGFEMGAHQLRGTGVYAFAVQNQPAGQFATSSTSSTYLLTNDELTTELGKSLRDSGYEVAENIFTGLGYFDGRVWDFGDVETIPPDFKHDYKVVYVKIDGRWYIADDRRI